MKTHYCWRCKNNVPMLEEDEWLQIEPLLKEQISNIQTYRQEHSCDIQTATRLASKPATKKYKELTGHEESDHEEIYHHRLSKFGPPCINCGHLLRTPNASFCANCQQQVQYA